MIVTPKFEHPGALPNPGPIGRVVRLLAGILLVYLAILTIEGYPAFVSLDFPTTPLIWIGVAVSFLGLPDVINVGFGRSWGRRPQLLVSVLGLATVAFNLARYGTV